MDELLKSFDSPLVWILIMWVFNATVQALPDPLESDNRIYVFVYRLAHGLAANINVVRKSLKNGTPKV